MYHNCYQMTFMFSSNPYRYRVMSPYGYLNSSSFYYMAKPSSRAYTMSIHQTISLNASLNKEAQRKIDDKEPKFNIWEEIDDVNNGMSSMTLGSEQLSKPEKGKYPDEKASCNKRLSRAQSVTGSNREKSSRFASLRKGLGIKSSEEKAVVKSQKLSARGQELRDAILAEENGRWPGEEWHHIVANYRTYIFN